MIGRTLSHYEITAKLGEGGMGEVWRATDTSLNREVAVKALPQEMAGDPERLERFKREAQAIAALNHPNIVTIHSVEEVDGVHLLTMELVEGPSLDHALPTGGFELDRLFPLAIQIADALAGAHEEGIVHRDLKPANVMMAGDDRVKVLDFGLAKLAGPELESAETQLMTREGMILGTVPYMSPEQVQAKPVDHRSDIFSFGILLYEMACGQRPFQGDNEASVISAVLKDQPPSLTHLKSELPNHLGRIVRRCLQKSPQRRYQSAREIQLELESLQAELMVASSASGPLSVAAPAPGTEPQRADADSPAPRRVRGALGWIVAAVLAAALVAGFGLGALGGARVGDKASLEAERATWVAIPPPVSEFAYYAAPSVSPDGRKIVYWALDEEGQVALWLRELDAPSARALPGTATGSDKRFEIVAPFWSPDGESIGFFAGGKLKRLDLDGGSPLDLADAVNPRGGTWGPDGTIVLAPASGEGLHRVSASAGEVSALPVNASTTKLSWPEFLPTGRHLLVTVDARPNEPGGFGVLALDGDRVEILEPRTTRPEYAAGWLFYAEKGGLFARRFDTEALAFSGEPVRIAEGIGFSFGNIANAAFSVSPGGTLAYWAGRSQPLTRLTWIGRNGAPLGSFGEVGEHVAFDLSPDGSKVVVERHDPESGQVAVWTIDGASGVASKLSAGQTLQSWGVGTPLWVPGSDEVLFVTFPGIARQSLKGGGLELVSDVYAWLDDVSADGRWVLLNVNDPETSYDQLVFSLEEGTLETLLAGPHDECQGSLSPDSRWLAYASNETGRMEVYVRPFDTEGRPVRISRTGGQSIAWRRDGREIYFISSDDELVAVPVEGDGETLRPGTPAVLFEIEAGLDLSRRQYVPGPDGSRFLVNQRVAADRPTSISLVLDWPAILDGE